MKVNGKRVRVVIRHEQTEEGLVHQAVLKDDYGNDIDESPKGHQAEAARYADNFRRYGAWKPS
jgi:hypothetical protein